MMKSFKLVHPGMRQRRRVLLLSVLVASTAGFSACGSGTTELAGPTADKCQISVGSFTRTFGASGGNGTVTVEAARECSWSAASQAEWISLPSSASGQGAGSFAFAVTPNQLPRERDGAIVLSGIRLGITQEPAPCRFGLEPAGAAVDAAGGSGTVNVAALEGCAWEARSPSSWVRITTGASGSGPGAVSYIVEPNAGPARSADVIIAGQAYRIEQADSADGSPFPPPATCAYALSPDPLVVPAPGGVFAVMLTTGEACNWSAQSDSPWATPDPPSGTGSRAISVSVQANTSQASRQAVLTVGGASVRIIQEGQTPTPSCNYVVSPLTVSFGPDGGQAQVRVTTGESCTWTAATQASWLSVEPATGTGTANVRITAERNTAEAQRAASVAIAGVAVAVTQEAAPPTAPTEVVVDGKVRSPSGACPVVTFRLKDWTVTTSASTAYQPAGATCASLADGVAVVVTGVREANDRVAATLITLEGNRPTP